MTLTGLISTKVDEVMNMTGFNYGIQSKKESDYCETLVFDSAKDAKKFQSLYNEL